MQDAACMESGGEQEDIIRGTRQRQFCPLPRLESGRMKTIDGLYFGPIVGINTGVDVVAMVGPMSVMTGRMMAGRMSLKKVEGSRSVRPVQFSIARHLPKENRRNGDGQTSAAGSAARGSDL
jgi:hypothetical protein